MIYLYIPVDINGQRIKGKALRLPNDRERMHEAAIVDYLPGPLGFLFRYENLDGGWNMRGRIGDIATSFGYDVGDVFDIGTE